jgi:hypothetical protein
MADGKTNPFGNGKGGDSGSKAGSRDFLKNPTQVPGPTSPDAASIINGESVHSGGKLPLFDPPSPRGSTSKPFKL